RGLHSRHHALPDALQPSCAPAWAASHAPLCYVSTHVRSSILSALWPMLFVPVKIPRDAGHPSGIFLPRSNVRIALATPIPVRGANLTSFGRLCQQQPIQVSDRLSTN